MLAPNVPRDAKKPGLKWAALVKPVQRLPQSHKGVVREVRRVLRTVEQPDKPPIQGGRSVGTKWQKDGIVGGDGPFLFSMRALASLKLGGIDSLPPPALLPLWFRYE